MARGTPLAVTVVGNDRPGIVAAVTRPLYELGCNLEDATSTILRGHFAMVLIVRAPADVDIAAVEERLSAVGDELRLIIVARPVDEARVEGTAPSHMVSVYGADKPGIVYRVADLIARAGGNITDLNSRLIGPEDEPVYALLMEVVLTQKEALERDLAALKEEIGVEVSLTALDADVL